MNILIIAGARCGGRYLMESLARTYNLKPFHQPGFGYLKKPNINLPFYILLVIVYFLIFYYLVKEERVCQIILPYCHWQ